VKSEKIVRTFKIQTWLNPQNSAEFQRILLNLLILLVTEFAAGAHPTLLCTRFFQGIDLAPGAQLSRTFILQKTLQVAIMKSKTQKKSRKEKATSTVSRKVPMPTTPDEDELFPAASPSTPLPLATSLPSSGEEAWDSRVAVAALPMAAAPKPGKLALPSVESTIGKFLYCTIHLSLAFFFWLSSSCAD
jgi:hypothetical protein